MVRRETSKKIVGLTITAVVIILIFTFLMPPSMAITLSPGTPSTSSVTTGQQITFNNVNISIQNVEHVPITQINFTIYTGTTKIANVSFHVDGTEILDQNNRFTVTLISPTNLSSIYTNATFNDTDYDGIPWEDQIGFGYGYGNDALDNITLSYQIVYTTTTQTGIFYAKLYAYTFFNSDTYIYNSTSSNTFTVSTGGGGPSPPGGDEGGDDNETSEPEPDITIPETILDDLETMYNIVLTEPFYANDTNNDGIIDTFTDPNGVLTSITNLTINGNQTFLISTEDDPIPEFFWDTNSNNITHIDYAPGTVTDTFHDEQSKTYTLVVTIEKNEWVFIEITDRFPPALYSNYTLTIQTPDGRNISDDHIWRQNNKIFVLDDPAAEYYFMYQYDELPPYFFAPTVEFDPTSGYTFVVQRPTISISFSKEVAIVTATLNTRDVRASISTTDNKNFTFIPTYDVENGLQVLSLTIIDSEGELYTYEASYTFNITDRPITIPWEIIIVLLVIIFVIIIFLIMFKTGFLYIEESPDEEPPQETTEPPVKQTDEELPEETPESTPTEPDESTSEEPTPEKPYEEEPEKTPDDQKPPAQQAHYYQTPSWEEPMKPPTPAQQQDTYHPSTQPSYPQPQTPVQQRFQPQYQPIFRLQQTPQQKKPQQNIDNEENTNN